MAAMSSERIEPDDNAWTRRLVLFLRIMAVISILKGLYHWAQVTGFIGGEEEAFENQSMAWQTATVYFAVIELVAAVGLWLATPWGAVVWLTTVVSMAVIELMFPGIYGGSLTVVGIEAVMLAPISHSPGWPHANARHSGRLVDALPRPALRGEKEEPHYHRCPPSVSRHNPAASANRAANPYNFQKFSR